MSRPWHPSVSQVGQLARGEAIVEWSGTHGWRVVPVSEMPVSESRKSLAPVGGGVIVLQEGASVTPSRSAWLSPAEILRRYPAAARKAGIR